jgi:hypothetical protein
MSMPGRPYTWSQTETWKRIGPDALTIDGHTINATKIQLETVPGPGATVGGVWDLWYDPARHLFLKGHTSANFRVPDFQVLSVSGP